MLYFLKRLSIILTMIAFISACKVGSPFKGPGYKSGKVIIDTKNDQVIIGLTYIKAGNDRKKNKLFWHHVMRVYDSMEQHEGLIGYAIRRELVGKQGWTMSVWKDQQSLDQFVQSDVHQSAIKNGMPALIETRFVRLSKPKADIPLTWNHVEQLLKSQGREY